MAFIISGALYSALEVALLSVILRNVLKGKMTNSVIFLFIKFISYGAAFALIYFFFMEAVKLLAVGYTAGVLISIPVILFLSKKNNKNQTSNEGDDKK